MFDVLSQIADFFVNIFKFIGMVVQGLVSLLVIIVQIPVMIVGVVNAIPPVLQIGVTGCITFAIILKCISMFWGVGKSD